MLSLVGYLGATLHGLFATPTSAAGGEASIRCDVPGRHLHHNLLAGDPGASKEKSTAGNSVRRGYVLSTKAHEFEIGAARLAWRGRGAIGNSLHRFKECKTKRTDHPMWLVCPLSRAVKFSRQRIIGGGVSKFFLKARFLRSDGYVSDKLHYRNH